jgi:hypothetical protein
MQEWLQNRGIIQGEQYRQFITEKDKASLDYQLYIDDKPTLTAPQILYDQSWNRGKESNNQYRIHSLNEAYRILKKR